MTTIISNTEIAAAINHKGAELVSLKKINSGREYMWDGNPTYWGKHSPILFPIVGTLKNNFYTYREVEYELPRHGFARDMTFDLIMQKDHQLIFSLQPNAETKKVFPFDFELQVIYTLNKSELKIAYKVLNKDSEFMFFSIGGHPAFATPHKFEEYSLQFESNGSLLSYQLEDDLLSEKTNEIRLTDNQLPLSYSLFENDALIFKELKSKQIRLLEHTTPILNFKFSDFPNFGIWTKTDAPFICLEPWIGYSDVQTATGNIAEKEGIQTLKGNASKEYSFSIEIL